MDQKKPYLVVLLIQSIYVGMFLLSKAAFNGGMKSCVFVFYRQAAATLFLAPLAVYFEWFHHGFQRPCDDLHIAKTGLKFYSLQLEHLLLVATGEMSADSIGLVVQVHFYIEKACNSRNMLISDELTPSSRILWLQLIKTNSKFEASRIGTWHSFYPNVLHLLNKRCFLAGLPDMHALTLMCSNLLYDISIEIQDDELVHRFLAYVSITELSLFHMVVPWTLLLFSSDVLCIFTFITIRNLFMHCHVS